MSKDAHAGMLAIFVVVAFAALVTAHVAVVHGQAKTRGRWPAVFALVVAPIAPYAAFRAGQPLRAFAWLTAAAGYVVALILAW